VCFEPSSALLNAKPHQPFTIGDSYPCLTIIPVTSCWNRDKCYIISPDSPLHHDLCWFNHHFFWVKNDLSIDRSPVTYHSQHTARNSQALKDWWLTNQTDQLISVSSNMAVFCFVFSSLHGQSYVFVGFCRHIYWKFWSRNSGTSILPGSFRETCEPLLRVSSFEHTMIS
jgi:hypothetical protein